mgnify:CR=1 FL=1
MDFPGTLTRWTAPALAAILGLVSLLAGLVLSSGVKGPSPSSTSSPGITKPLPPTLPWVFAPISPEGTDGIQVSPTVAVGGVVFPLSFKPLVRSGGVLGGGIFGVVRNTLGAPLIRGALPSQNPANSVPLILANQSYLLTPFTTTPGALYLSQLAREGNELAMSATRSLDLSPLGGLIQPRGIASTPWRTWLVTEDLNLRGDRSPEAMVSYRRGKAVDPYGYGWPVELHPPDQDKDAVGARRLGMGRLGASTLVALPDSRSIYLGAGRLLYLYVADNPGDLSTGRLFAAQGVSDPNSGGLQLNWRDLGSLGESAITPRLEGKVSLGDLYDSANPGRDGQCPSGYTLTSPRECLRFRPAMESLAGRLEPRRAALVVGATGLPGAIGGLAYDPHNQILYLALPGGEADPATNPCGAVYSMPLGTETSVAGGLVGRRAQLVTAGWFAAKGCDSERVVHPTSLAVLPGGATLLVGEEGTAGRVWAMDPGQGHPTRALVSPAGLAVTGLHYQPDLLGQGYLMVALSAVAGTGRDTIRGMVGYLGPFPEYRF